MSKEKVDNKNTKPIKSEKKDKPTLEKGNYVIEVVSEGQVIKKLAVANSEVNILKLADGGLAIELR